MNACKRWVVLSFLLSIGAFIISFLRIDVQITNDTYISLVLTLVGICVTIMVGYQIYSIIDSKKSIEDYKRDLNNRLDERIKLLNESHDNSLKDIAEIYGESYNIATKLFRSENRDLDRILGALNTISSIISSYSRRMVSGSDDDFSKWVAIKIELLILDLKIISDDIDCDLTTTNKRNTLYNKSLLKDYKGLIIDLKYSVMSKLKDMPALVKYENDFRKIMDKICDLISILEKR